MADEHFKSIVCLCDVILILTLFPKYRNIMGAGESKLAFRKQAISLSEDSSATSIDWAGFYTTPDSAEDIFNLFSHSEIRAALEKNPKNIAILIQKVRWLI